SYVCSSDLTVSEADGTEIATATSAEDGTWTVLVDAPGTYLVTLDESTLPDGLLVRNGRPQLEVEVRSAVRTVLFPLDTRLDEDARSTESESPDGDDTDDEEPEGATAGDEAEEEIDPDIEGADGATRAISLLFSGIHFGLMIALAAVGLSMVFGTTGLTNFSHGDLVTFGGVMALLVNVTFGLPVWAAAIGAVVAGALFGWLQDWGLWSRLRKRGTGLITMMIISIGVAMLIRFATLFFVGAERRRYDEYVGQEPWD